MRTKYLVFFGILFLAVFALSANTAEASVLRKAPNNLGLVGYWSFEDATGTIATDFSGNGNVGVLTDMDNTDWVDGKVGQALDFDGSGYVATPNQDLSGSISFALWVLRETYSVETYIFAQSNNFGLFAQSGTQLRVKTYGLSDNDIAINGIGVSATIWYHVAFVYDKVAETKTTYLDGVQDTQETSITGDITSGTSTLDIGARGGGGQRFEDGKTDEVRIYNRAFSATEVSSLYDRSKRRVVANVSQHNRVTDGLVGMWSFDSSYLNTTTSTDVSGNGNDGTLNGSPSPISGKVGQALDFTGSEYVAIPNQDLSGDISLSAWVMIDSYTSQTYIIGQSDNFGFLSQADGSVMILTTGLSDTNMFVDPNYGEWFHIVFTYDKTAGIKTSYLNGIQSEQETSITGDITSGATTFEIGARGGSFQKFEDGKVDEVRLYDRALSATEVLKLYNMGEGTKVNTSQNTRLTDGLVGFWTFNGQDLNTTTSTDVSGYGNDGTLTNGPVPIAGKIGQALNFDGSSSRVEIDLSSGDVLPITLVAWVKFDTITDQHTVISYADQDTSTNNYYRISIDSGHWRIQVDDDASNPDALSSPENDPNINTWYHVAGVFTDTVGVELFVDGVSVATTGTNAADLTSPDLISIGVRVSSNKLLFHHFVDGQIDETRIYDRALSVAEILQLYNMGK